MTDFKLFDSINVGIAILNNQNKLLFFNSHFRKIFKIKQSEIIVFSQLNEDNIEKIIREKNSQPFEIELKNCNHEIFLVELDCTINNSETNSAEYILRVISSERKSREPNYLDLEKKLKALESDFNNFIYITSHDLKAPLRGIIALASWIHDDYRSILDDQGRAHLILLIDRVQKLSNMFDGILALSRISNNNNTIEPVNIDSIINSILENCDIKINLDINEELPTILTDKAKLKSIFEILIYNSVTHSQNALNDISIGYNQEKSYFYLNDNGIGIEEKYHDKVFDIFFKVKSDEKTRIGVGLAIAKKIVNSLNGSISINKDYTKGVEFIFTLPKIN